MGCVYLLGTAELKSRNQVGRCHPHVLFHTDFHATFYQATAESFTEIGRDQKKVAWFNVETEDHLELVVCKVFDSCGVLLCFPQNLKIFKN